MLTASRTVGAGSVASIADTAHQHGHSIVVLGIVTLIAIGDTSAVGSLQQATDPSLNGRHAGRSACQPAQECKHKERPHGFTGR
jgi:hypothetical protein